MYIKKKNQNVIIQFFLFFTLNNIFIYKNRVVLDVKLKAFIIIIILYNEYDKYLIIYE